MRSGEQTRENIIRQAAALFNQQGFAGASMSDIMLATGLQKGGIYRHFESKEALALEAFDYAVACMGARFAAGLAPFVADGLATEIRGRGLMIGVETARAFAKSAVAIAREEHALLVNATGETTLRLVPPLTINAEEVDQAVVRLRSALEQAAA